MQVKDVFCNIPWTEVHINADGTYHTCGSQPNPMSLTLRGQVYNVRNMSIEEWINSDYQCTARKNKVKGISEPLCGQCYAEDAMGSSSKRVKENLKSGISDLNFVKDYQQSVDRKSFDLSEQNNGLTDMEPYSFHMSLGNECNLACRMCGPTASSKIAVNEIQAGTYHGPARMNWTTNQEAWDNVVNFICNTQILKFVHIIGGEPLMNPKFEELVDRLIAAGKTDIYFGFTTNGTMINIPLLEKLQAFRHVDIGVSIETIGELNDAIRDGSSTKTVLDNIDTYLKYRSESHVYVTVRPVPSALSVHTLDELYKWCISRELDVLTNMLTFPEYQQIRNLPKKIKARLLTQYSRWEYSKPMPGTSDPRDPTRFREHIDSEIRAIINCLEQPADILKTQELYDKLESWGWLQNSKLKKYFEI
ncbi:Radical_SAM domain containing protein [uncultured Caudovirales phage]|uniref:Radical_SAM domain containing protein n=1 Tax=uncultured Caudovirales phage TaxID=2100421 RepID=A0A6J5L6J2_9CAUD|nr:Radical_SAM domain containing protein [uncultured Caudovirales phage]